MATATDITSERFRVAERLHGKPSDWLPVLWRGYTKSTPLTLLDDVLVRATRDDNVRAVYSSSVRHGKTTLTMAGIVRFLATRPGEAVMLCGHSQDFIEGKSRTIRDAAVRAGLKLRRDSAKLGHWELVNGASLIAAGVGAGGLTGSGASLIVCDDLFATREQAESAHERDRVDAWLTGTALTRLTPTGSAIISGARWHLDDVHARLAERGGWEMHAQPAIDEHGRALWPEGGWTLDKLDAKRREIGEYDFASLYLCSPVPRGGAMVKSAPLTYGLSDLLVALDEGARIVTSIDPSTGGAQRGGDYSAIVTMALLGYGANAHGWILNVVRERLELPALAARVRAIVAEYGASLVLAEAVAGFKGVPQTLRALDRTLRVVEVQPKGDKLTRATPFCAAVESGRVRVPDTRPAWLPAFTGELLAFPVGKHDDQIDAAAQAFNLAALSPPRHTAASLAAARARILRALPFGG